jgi:hypothetical protein
MLRLIQFLIFGHVCKWKATSQSTFQGSYGDSGPIVYVVCEKCGKRSSFKNASIGDWEK